MDHVLSLSPRTFPGFKSDGDHLEICLKSIGFINHNQPPSSKLLRELISRYTQTIPFSNVAFCLEESIYLDFESIFSKLILCKKGGCCYELHGLFNWILEELGFYCSVIPVLINRNRKEVTREIQWAKIESHVFTQVFIDKVLYIVEIGVGSINQPLKLFDCASKEYFKDVQMGSDGVQYKWVWNQQENVVDLFFYDTLSFGIEEERGWIARNRIDIDNLAISEKFRKRQYPEDFFLYLSYAFIPESAMQSGLLVFRPENNGSSIRWFRV
jgi:hypothetical protein